MTKVKSTQIVQIYNKLEDVLNKTTDGSVHYDNGWSDKRVAEEIGVPASTVSRVRNENFGPIKAKNGEGRDSLARRIDELEKRVSELEDVLTKVSA